MLFPLHPIRARSSVPNKRNGNNLVMLFMVLLHLGIFEEGALP